ncbi:MAG: TolC family protein [Lachnospiraceae bacterium]
MKKKTGIVSGLLLVGILSALTVIPAVAASQEGIGGGPGATEDTTAADPGSVAPEYLTDQVLEYSELQEMIHYFNPTMQDQSLSKEESRKDYTDANTYLNNEAESAKRQKQNAKDEGDMDAYNEYASQEKVLRSAAKSYSTMLDRLDAYSSNKSSLQTERQLTVTAQSLMVSYTSLTNQKTTLEKTLQLYQQLADSTRNKYSAGMATQLEVLETENRILTAESSLLDLQNSIDTIYESLCLLVGQNRSDGLRIAAVTLADLTGDEERNLEQNIDTALGNNYTLIQYRNSLSTNTTAATEYKFRTIAEGEEKLTIQIKNLYNDMEQTRDALGVALLGYEQAVLQKQNADTSYRIGLISKDEYLNQELSYLQKEAAKKSAELDYLQAVTTYDWAITGIADFE